MFPVFKIQLLPSKLTVLAKLMANRCTYSSLVKKRLGPSTNLLNVRSSKVVIKWHSDEIFGSSKPGSNFRWGRFSAVVVGFFCIGYVTYKYYREDIDRVIEGIYFDFLKAVNVPIVKRAVVAIEIKGLLGTITVSGFIVKSDGLILTNAHGVQHNGQKVVVKLSNGQSYNGIIEYHDSTANLAVVKINASSLPVLKFVENKKTKVGESVVAIGSNQLSQTHATSGIISSLQKPLPDDDELINYIQTDTAITEEKSGGPLINVNGEVVGINITMCKEVGFAIPSWDFIRMNGNYTNGSVTGVFPKIEGFGITVFELDPEGLKDFKIPIERFSYSHGFLVHSVLRNSIAYERDLRPGDIIVKINGEPIYRLNSFIKLVSGNASKVKWTYYSKNEYDNF